MSLDALAADLASLGGDEGLRLTPGVITAVTGTTFGSLSNVVTALFDGVNSVPNVHYLGHPPRIGETAWCLVNGTDRLMLGALGTGGYPVDLAQPRVCVVKTDAASVTSATDTTVNWTSTEYEDDGDVWTGAAPSRLTAPVAGLYLFTCGWVWDTSSAVGRRVATLRANGTTDFGRSEPPANNTTTAAYVGHTITREKRLSAGGYAELVVRQESGAGLAYYHAGVGLNFMTMRRVAA